MMPQNELYRIVYNTVRAHHLAESSQDAINHFCFLQIPGLEKTQGLKKTAGFLGFIVFFFRFYCYFFGFYCFFFRFYYVFLYYCVLKLFLTRKKKITVQQMFHLEVLLRHLSEYCHYACAEQDVRFLTQHVHVKLTS